MNIRSLPIPRGLIKSIIKRMPWIPDEAYLSMFYALQTGKKLNWNHPVTYTEKLQVMKLQRKQDYPEYAIYQDKAAIKDLVRERIGEEYVVPTYGVWDKAEDIDFDILPEKFVLKPTHGGGGKGVMICKDKGSLDLDKARKIQKKYSRRLLWKRYREYILKGVKPRIIAEMLLENPADPDHLEDFKFFCFNGKCRFFKINFITDTHHANYYTPDFELLEIEEKVWPRVPDADIPRPKNLELMIELAEKMALGFNYVRVDFYNIDGKIYFGELAFYPSSGFGVYGPEWADEWLGSLITI